METGRLWLLLNQLAQQVGVEVRLEALEDGEGYKANGGLCRLGGSLVAIVDRRVPPEERARQLGRALAGRDLDGVYLRPTVREFLGSLKPPSGEEE